MIHEQQSVDEIKNWFNAVKKGEIPFEEAEGIEVLAAIKKETDSTLSEQEYAQLLAQLAKKRYERRERMDPLAIHWINQALEKDDANQLAREMLEKVTLNHLMEIDIPASFPPIRETDHIATKKQTAAEYHKIAKQFLHDVQNMKIEKDKLNETKSYAGKTHEQSFMNDLLTYLMELEEQFIVIKHATGEYAETASSVYYSKSQFQLIREAIKEIEHVKQIWDEKLEERGIKQAEETALDELEKMIGLKEVKKRIKKLYQFHNYQKKRLAKGLHSKDELNLHMILTGNPGTGKTHLARLMAKIYYEIGLLEQDTVYEVDRSDLVGAYVGQTEEKTMQAIERASGGVLFIDEAYSLRRMGASGNDYGQTVIDTLVSALTNEKYAGTFLVILAGYPNEMRSFLRTNPGLRSRFPEQNQIHINNYSAEELLQIGELIANENDYLLTNRAKVSLKKQIEYAQVDDTFGNARTVKNMIMDAIFQKGAKLSLDKAMLTDFIILEENDFNNEKKDDERSAVAALDQLIGLASIKNEVKRLTSFANIQQIRREKGLQTSPLQLHAVFSGNPGTGKTTVARIYAKALKELGFLKRGHLIEASRADLVAGYTGQTAQKTKEKIEDALGGVLFIDEAYSLYSPNRNDFGREAIHTLVQEMTVHEENLVVIFAGYTNEMDELLRSNPGLRSRFKSHLSFPDYTKEELLSIILNRAKQFGYQFSDEAKKLLNNEVMKEHPANGRHAVDVFEKLVQLQSIRLNDQCTTEIEALQTITVEDVKQLT